MVSSLFLGIKNFVDKPFLHECAVLTSPVTRYLQAKYCKEIRAIFRPYTLQESYQAYGQQTLLQDPDTLSLSPFV